MPHGQFSLQELYLGDSPSLPCSVQEAGKWGWAAQPHTQGPRAQSSVHWHTAAPCGLLPTDVKAVLPLTASQLSEPASCCLPGMWCHPKWPSTSESGTCWAESSRHTWVPTLLGKKKKREPVAETAFQRPTICYPQNNCTARPKHLVSISSLKLWMADLKTTHYCQGMKTSGSPFWKENVTLTACNQPSCGRIMDIL